MRILGSARASRAGDGALAIANFDLAPRVTDFGEAPKSAREGACAPRVRRSTTASNLSELTFGSFSEKRGTVSPFQQFTLSSIIQGFLKIKMNIQPLNLGRFTNVVAASPPEADRGALAFVSRDHGDIRHGEQASPWLQHYL